MGNDSYRPLSCTRVLWGSVARLVPVAWIPRQTFEMPDKRPSMKPYTNGIYSQKNTKGLFHES